MPDSSSVTFSGIFMSLRAEQLLNAPDPIDATLSGISILFNEEQFINALLPIDVIPSEIIICPEMSDLPEKALPFIAVTGFPS